MTSKRCDGHKRNEMLSGGGIDYVTAHRLALHKYDVSPFSVYHPDVIKNFLICLIVFGKSFGEWNK